MTYEELVSLIYEIFSEIMPDFPINVVAVYGEIHVVPKDQNQLFDFNYFTEKADLIDSILTRCSNNEYHVLDYQLTTESGLIHPKFFTISRIYSNSNM